MRKKADPVTSFFFFWTFFSNILWSCVVSRLIPLFEVIIPYSSLSIIEDRRSLQGDHTQSPNT